MYNLSFDIGHWSAIAGIVGYVVAYCSPLRVHSRHLPLGLLLVPFLPGHVLINVFAALTGHAAAVRLHFEWYSKRTRQGDTDPARQGRYRHALALTLAGYLVTVFIVTNLTAKEALEYTQAASERNIRESGLPAEAIDTALAIESDCKARTCEERRWPLSLRAAPSPSYGKCIDEHMEGLAKEAPELAGSVALVRQARMLTREQERSLAAIFERGPFTVHWENRSSGANHAAQARP